MLMNASDANCGDYVIKYANIESLCCAHEINMYMSIMPQLKKDWSLRWNILF